MAAGLAALEACATPQGGLKDDIRPAIVTSSPNENEKLTVVPAIASGDKIDAETLELQRFLEADPEIKEIHAAQKQVGHKIGYFYALRERLGEFNLDKLTEEQVRTDLKALRETFFHQNEEVETVVLGKITSLIQLDRKGVNSEATIAKDIKDYLDAEIAKWRAEDGKLIARLGELTQEKRKVFEGQRKK